MELLSEEKPCTNSKSKAYYQTPLSTIPAGKKQD